MIEKGNSFTEDELGTALPSPVAILKFIEKQ